MTPLHFLMGPPLLSLPLLGGKGYSHPPPSTTTPPDSRKPSPPFFNPPSYFHDPKERGGGTERGFTPSTASPPPLRKGSKWALYLGGRGVSTLRETPPTLPLTQTWAPSGVTKPQTFSRPTEASGNFFFLDRGQPFKLRKPFSKGRGPKRGRGNMIDPPERKGKRRRRGWSTKERGPWQPPTLPLPPFFEWVPPPLV